jgi:undecaprenyl-diphosphatase
MSIISVLVLGIVQGLAELLPVSSTAHVIVAEKLLGLDPSSPPMTLLLVMLHTGTMFAVIVYFWRAWRDTYFQSGAAFKSFAAQVIVATALTAVVYEVISLGLGKTVFANTPKAEIEDLFGHLEFIAPALAAVGILILIAGLATGGSGQARADDLTLGQSSIIGAVQGICLPFRGFSRSGATISTGMLLQVSRRRVEAFSFALAVVLTPPVVVREGLRLVKSHGLATTTDLSHIVLMSAFGTLIAFIAGLAALKWLSRWLETDRWYLFGIYCLIAAGAVTWLHTLGY